MSCNENQVKQFATLDHCKRFLTDPNQMGGMEFIPGEFCKVGATSEALNIEAPPLVFTLLLTRIPA